MPPTPDLRAHVLDLLRGGHAHLTLEQSLRGLSFADAGRKPPRAPYTAWQQVEHMRLANWDILEVVRNPAHESPAWPEGYWPLTAKPPSSAAWRRSRADLLADFDAFLGLVSDVQQDLLAPLAHAPDKTLLREALLLADHNAYHIGQLVLVRRLLGAWRG